MARTAPWTVEDLPDLSGRTAIVTGGNSGIGYQAALGLARKGAHVVLACRSLPKADEAIGRITASHPGAKLEARALDLASLESVRSFAKSFLDDHGELHVLCNNAGVMRLPYRKTAEGFEMQIGTNHLGPFALTGLLIERLLATPGARVVTVSSTMHRPGKIRFDDLHWERGYQKWGAYCQSKLANLLFAFELQRRLDARGASVLSVACHPGYAATALQTKGPKMEGASFLERVNDLGNRLIAQDAAMGALPTLYAAAAPDVAGGDYIGPDGIAEFRGYPRKVGSTARARDPEAARRLWQLSEELTGVGYPGLDCARSIPRAALESPRWAAARPSTASATRRGARTSSWRSSPMPTCSPSRTCVATRTRVATPTSIARCSRRPSTARGSTTNGSATRSAGASPRSFRRTSRRTAAGRSPPSGATPTRCTPPASTRAWCASSSSRSACRRR